MPLLPRIAAAAFAVIFLVNVQTARGASVPGESELARAEKIVAELRRLDEAATGDARAYASAYERLYPGLYAAADSLRAGDLKTDLSTSVALHDAAFRAHLTPGRAAVDCDAELRPVYRLACRELRDPTRASVMRAKARLHARWADSAVGHARGRRDAETLCALSEMRSERVNDLVLAGRAVELLQALERDVNPYASRAAYEAGRVAANVPFERLEASLADSLGAVDRLLAALPRGGPVYASLRNARNSYRDGLFWYRQTHRRAARTIRADALAAPDPIEAARLDPEAAGYTVVINWRHARFYTAEARDLLRASRVLELASK